MPKQIMTVMLAVIALSAAQARIGQTSKEVIQDAGREKAASVQWVEVLGRTMLRVQYHDDVILHLFGSDGREIAFYYYATKGLKPQDVDKLQRKYRTTWRGMGTEDGVFNWESDNGLWMTAMRLQAYDYLCIFDESRTQEMPEIRNALPPSQQPYAVATPPKTYLSTDPNAGLPTIATIPDERDCLLVATEAYARMKDTAHWAKIAGFTWFENAKKVGGHAVVFYQPTADSNIWMYDKSGSYETHTKSHELDEIIGALNASLGGSTIRIESPRWLESGGKDKEFTSADRQPAWSSVTKSTSQRTTEQTGSSAQAVVVIAFAIAVGVGLRYAGIRLWPLYIIAGPVYNLIEYFRSYRRIARLKRINAAMLDRWANGEIAPEEEQLFDDYFGVPLEAARAHTQARWDYHDFTLKEKEQTRSQQQ